MRKVSTRDLRMRLSENISSLPFVITNRGKDVAMVTKVGDVYTRTGKNTDNVYTKKVDTLCKHGCPPNLCKDSRCRN